MKMNLPMVGRTFKEWNTKSDGSGTPFGETDAVVNLTDEETCRVKEIVDGETTIILYAQWKDTDYTVTFDYNGGTKSIKSKKVTFGSIYGTLPTTTKTGYNFQGWYILGNAGSEIEVESSTEVKHAANHTLTAKWTPITYTFKFHPNDGTGEMKDLVCKYGKKYNLPKNTFARSGYKFVSWNTKGDGTGTKYTNEQLIEDWVEYDGTIIDLYAQWSANVYTVTFDANKGNLNTSQTTKQVIFDEQYGDLPEPKRDGYSFQGWYLNTQKIESSTIVATAEDHTLTAKWEPHKYSIVYSSNADTSGTTETSTHTYDEAKNLTPNGYTYQGHKFIGWNTKSDGTGKSYEDKESVKNLTPDDGAKVYLYAQWERNIFTITYNLNGGKWNYSNSHVVEFNSTFTISTYSPTKSGYFFKGWDTDSSATTVVYKYEGTNSFTVTGDVELYAVYGSSAVASVTLNPTGTQWVLKGNTLKITATVNMVDSQAPTPSVSWSGGSSNISYSSSTASGAVNEIKGTAARNRYLVR